MPCLIDASLGNQETGAKKIFFIQLYGLFETGQVAVFSYSKAPNGV